MVALGACAGDDDASVRAAFEDLRLAYFAGDYQRVCERLDTAALRQLDEMGHGPAVEACPGAMDERLSAIMLSRRDRVEPRIIDVAVDGHHAAVIAALSGGAPTIVRFIKSGARWKLRKLFDTSAPPPPDMR
ncbi:MAG TPA: hypothetical protein VGF45_16730 [Polyangia bacterium]